MENTSDSFKPGPLLFCMKIERSVCYKVTDNTLILTRKIGKIKKGKYTYIIYSKDFPKSAGNPSCVSAEVEETTGNRLALLCLAAALQRLRRPSLLTIHTDNRYLQNGYQSLPAWKENGWTRTGNQELRNADLWQQVDKLFGGHAVRFKIEKMDE